jgi:CheY-like chemotaxis protein
MKPTILVVDDEPSVLSYIAGVLAKAGYRVLSAHSAAAAIELFDRREGCVHLLLTDVVMPGMNGPDLAQELQRRKPDLPVLFIAGLPDSAVIRQGVLARGMRLLPKPFLPPDLKHAVGIALGPLCAATAAGR